MNVRDLIIQLFNYDTSLNVAFLKIRKEKSNEVLHFLKIDDMSEEFISIEFEGNNEDEREGVW